MDRETFKLITEAAHYAERLLKLDTGCWLNTFPGRIQVFVAVKGHPIASQIPNRPTLAAQAVFGLQHRGRLQDDFPFTEASPAFRHLTANWGGLLIKKPVDPLAARSHQPRKKLDLGSLFSVSVTMGNKEQRNLVTKSFHRSMIIFLEIFLEDYTENYNEKHVLEFSEKTKNRLAQSTIIKHPDTSTLV